MALSLFLFRLLLPFMSFKLSPFFFIFNANRAAFFGPFYETFRCVFDSIYICKFYTFDSAPIPDIYKICIAKVRTIQLYICKNCSFEICASKVRFSKISMRKKCSYAISICKINSFKIRFEDVSSCKISLIKASASSQLNIWVNAV